MDSYEGWLGPMRLFGLKSLLIIIKGRGSVGMNGACLGVRVASVHCIRGGLLQLYHFVRYV